MPITLAQAGVNAANDVDFSVIDDFRRNSWLLDQMVFDDTVTPASNGASLAYTYVRLLTAAAAAPRAFNTEYVPGQATRQQYTVNLKPFGGSFTLDRAFRNLGPSTTNEIAFQMAQLQTSTRLRFIQELIQGDTSVDARGFDGLSKLLVGASTEVNAVLTDWTAATVVTQALAMARLDELDYMLSLLTPSTMGSGDLSAPGAVPAGQKAILGNTKAITRLRALLRWGGLVTATKDDLGRMVERYGDWVLVDLGDSMTGDSTLPMIPITAGGVTALYAVTFGLDGLHAASAAGNPLVQTWLPDFSPSGALKTGEVELGPAAIVLKSTKAVGVLRGIDVV